MHAGAGASSACRRSLPARLVGAATIDGEPGGDPGEPVAGYLGRRPGRPSVADRFRPCSQLSTATRHGSSDLIGIIGDPVPGRKLIEWAKKENKKLKSKPLRLHSGFHRQPERGANRTAIRPAGMDLGYSGNHVLRPMSGGGSIPFEACGTGLTVHANELNPVASVILKATLDYPARFGPSLVDDIRKYGTYLVRTSTRPTGAVLPARSDPDEKLLTSGLEQFLAR